MLTLCTSYTFQSLVVVKKERLIREKSKNETASLVLAARCVDILVGALLCSESADDQAADGNSLITGRVANERC